MNLQREKVQGLRLLEVWKNQQKETKKNVQKCRRNPVTFWKTKEKVLYAENDHQCQTLLLGQIR